MPFLTTKADDVTIYDRSYVYGYVIVEPDAERPYFCHSVPLEYVETARKKGGKVYEFRLQIPPGPGLPICPPVLATPLNVHRRVFVDILEERQRQDAKFPVSYPDGTGGHAAARAASILRNVTDCADKQGTCTFADVLAEETAEALEETDQVRLRAELVQVAAVCVKWIEEIDRRSA